MITLATPDEVIARLGRSLDPSERVRLEAVLEDISGLVRDLAGRDFLNEAGTALFGLPHTVRAVVLKAAERAMRNPDGFASESVGDYTYARRGAEDGSYLTEREEKVIRKALGKTSLWTQPTTRGDLDMFSTGWVEDNYGCELFPLDVYRD